jgi:signal transduction histidine kinase
VDRLVRDVTDEFRGQVDSHDLTLSLEASKDAPLIVDTDKDRVRQILANLLSNAIKYTSRGGKVSVRAEKHSENGAGEWVTVAVQDTGIGISSEEQARLFKEFSRFKSGVAEGAGIGLAISQRLAEALKGKITLRSKERVGSTFTLWLPVHW